MTMIAAVVLAAAAAHAQHAGPFAPLIASTELAGDCRSAALCAARSIEEGSSFEAIVRGEGSAIDRRWARIVGVTVRYTRRGATLGSDATTGAEAFESRGWSLTISPYGDVLSVERIERRVCAGEAACLAEGAGAVDRVLAREGAAVKPVFIASFVTPVPALARPAILRAAQRFWAASLTNRPAAEDSQSRYLACYSRCWQERADARGCAEDCP